MDLDVSCLMHLNDYHWCFIISRLSLADQLNLSETCQRFYYLIVNRQLTIRFQEHFEKIYSSKEEITDFIRAFVHKFKAKYYLDSVEQSDELYFEYFFYHFEARTNPKKIVAHLLWCQRNYSLKDNCIFCSQVIKFYKESPLLYLHSKYYSDLWNKDVEKVFSDELHYQHDINKISADCYYFENIYSFSQLVNLIGVIALRVFFNLSKKFIFTVQLKQKELFYNFLVSESIQIFQAVCDNIDIKYVEDKIKVLKPYNDYDATSLKITNCYYLKYLEEKNVYESFFSCT